MELHSTFPVMGISRFARLPDGPDRKRFLVLVFQLDVFAFTKVFDCEVLVSMHSSTLQDCFSIHFSA